MQIKYLDTQNEKAWQNFVLKMPQANFFHSVGWKKVIGDTFRLPSFYLYAEDNGKICGILPLFLVKSMIFGSSLISVPFGVYGGICAENEQAERLLFTEAQKIAKAYKVGHVEFRNLEPGMENLPTKDLYMVFILDLPDDAEIVWKSMRKRNRNILRKGIKSGLKLYRTAEPGDIDPDEFNQFYELFAITQQALGTPVLPKSFFQNQLKEFGSQISIFSATYEGKIITSMWTFFFKDTVLPYYIGYNKDYLRYAPNNWILWEIIKYSCERG